jgi:HTH-type transcriptional regulator / antitoxin HigA
MNISIELKPIRSAAEYENALRAVSRYFDDEPQVGTPEADQFEMLLMLIEAYEAKHYAVTSPDPIEAIKFRMEQAGLTPKDLEPMIGRTNRVYEILAGRRPLTLNMIRKLHAGLGIPAESLIGRG